MANIYRINQFEVTVNRKKVKYLRLKLSGSGEFSVSAPTRATNQQISNFLSENQVWMGQAYSKWRQNEQKKQLILKNREQGIKDGILKQLTKDEFEKETLKAVEYWQDVIGVRPERVRFREMKTRWGVCNIKTRIITINSNLINYPLECLEYVVVHELTHLLHAGHGKDFWSVVGHNLPNYKTLRAMLK